jgi:tRNA(Ile)-lysidine synthase
VSFLAFEHSLIDHYKKQSLKKVYTVACSGGLDSVVLLESMLSIRPVLKFELQVLHVHHGFSSEKKNQSEYRNKALKFVENLAKVNSLNFISSQSKDFLESEEECRDFRIEVFKNSKNVLTAHHKDDFLETLVLRMMRGSGPQGLASPFKEQNLKPFLHLFNQNEIKDYALSKKINWCDDPSNQNIDPLRNWVRNEWLQELDKKIGKSGFEKSLLLISQALSEVETVNSDELITFKSDVSGSFRLENWLILDRFQKQSMIARILLKVRKTGYTHGQIEEVVKQLEQTKKNAAFRSGKLEWIKSESKVLFKIES